MKLGNRDVNDSELNYCVQYIHVPQAMCGQLMFSLRFLPLEDNAQSTVIQESLY